MNRDCHGDYFEVGGHTYYRCLRDSTVVVDEVAKGKPCPHCKRISDGSPATVAAIRITREVDICWGDSVVTVALPMGSLDSDREDARKWRELQAAGTKSADCRDATWTRAVELAQGTDRSPAEIFEQLLEMIDPEGRP